MPDSLKTATTLLNANRPAEARAMCQRLCEASPDYAEAWYLLGAINGQLGDFTACEQCNRRVIALQPDSARAWTNLGSALLLQQRVDEAVTARLHGDGGGGLGMRDGGRGKFAFP